jgi:hypothetical protein
MPVIDPQIKESLQKQTYQLIIQLYLSIDNMGFVLNCTTNEALLWIKDAIANNRFFMIPRTKNNQGLIQLGLTTETLKTLICSLTHRNYCSGPEEDRDRPNSGEVWLYGEDVNGTEAYIKIKIFKVNALKHAKCISIHPAVHSMSYPNGNG